MPHGFFAVTRSARATGSALYTNSCFFRHVCSYKSQPHRIRFCGDGPWARWGREIYLVAGASPEQEASMATELHLYFSEMTTHNLPGISVAPNPSRCKPNLAFALSSSS